MSPRRLALLFVAALVLAGLVAALLVTIFERRQEARLTFFQVGEVEPLEPDPAVWGRSFPRHYELYVRTMETGELADYSKYGRYGGSEAFSRLDKYPNYVRLFAGYPFSLEYREDRGHMHALEDMLATRRLEGRKPGTCMTCKSSEVPRLMESMGPETFYATPVREIMETHAPEHSVSCADCHEAGTMALQVTRPAFVEAMARRGVEVAEADRPEMRVYVCAQCHVEYYFRGEGNYLVFPWDRGLTIDSIAAYYDEIDFADWTHGETGARMVKMQHPEFELWSTGIHARAGVGCVDCHMPFRREGAVKITDHWIRTPLVNIGNACGTCHRLSEEELAERVITVQDRTFHLLERAEEAILGAQSAIADALEAGVSEPTLADARRLHRAAQIRWDFISAENSMGFHSPQEAARVLGDAIDLGRRAELSAVRAATERDPAGS